MISTLRNENFQFPNVEYLSRTNLQIKLMFSAFCCFYILCSFSCNNNTYIIVEQIKYIVSTLFIDFKYNIHKPAQHSFSLKFRLYKYEILIYPLNIA